jgi:hypothetical protein
VGRREISGTCGSKEFGGNRVGDGHTGVAEPDKIVIYVN